ncbi:PLP-dependent transferase [Trichodelitschia bisporula]|uniref:PLP-dependent transferase n=1 Tax=Trichodelitschia bisporula TaxID=703511 RepID=A0A6G1HM78_9PEZI|nr:PLP-dependent transferase [Trichodelitschia bisporula]
MSALNDAIVAFRDTEYPQLKGKAYLDHAGSQLPAASFITAFASDLNTTLYGNPHSTSTPSHLAGARVDAIRARTLAFFNASPEDYDLVFVANATAAIRLVGECFRDHALRARKHAFWYAHHRDAHNSLIGIREFATEHHCFGDKDVEAWLSNPATKPSAAKPALFAYPGQSNMTGRRLPLDWPVRIRATYGNNAYTLLDAAALATTAPLNIDAIAPDFACVSFYKIFGYPDLGALIVRKASADILRHRTYFAGGTVDVVVSDPDTWHVKRKTLHEALEEGTVAFRSIVALGHALDTHKRLYGSMEAVSTHTAALTRGMHAALAGLRHGNGQPMVWIHNEATAMPGDAKTQGATVAFNVLHGDGTLVPYGDVEREADARGVYVRSGGMCNPGGVQKYLGWNGKAMKMVLKAGHGCATPIQVHEGKATGVVRASLGACSVQADVDALVKFLRSQYLEKAASTTTIYIATGAEAELESVSEMNEKATMGKVKRPVGWAKRVMGLAGIH